MSTGVGGYAWSQVAFRGRYVRGGYIPGMGMLGNGYVWGRVCPGGGFVQVVCTKPPGHGTWDTMGYGWQLECFLVVIELASELKMTTFEKRN